MKYVALYPDRYHRVWNSPAVLGWRCLRRSEAAEFTFSGFPEGSDTAVKAASDLFQPNQD
jgi:hypothetical protein